MRLRTFEYRHAESVLGANLRLRKEIERILDNLELDPGSHTNGDANRPHQQIQRAFLRHGWRAESLVSARTAHRQYFDLYKDRVAIEIELTNREMLYRDYLRFQVAETEGTLDVGVIIVFDRDPRYSSTETAHNSHPHLEDVVDDLKALRGLVAVPIWVLAIS